MALELRGGCSGPIGRPPHGVGCVLCRLDPFPPPLSSLGRRCQCSRAPGSMATGVVDDTNNPCVICCVEHRLAVWQVSIDLDAQSRMVASTAPDSASVPLGCRWMRGGQVGEPG